MVLEQENLRALQARNKAIARQKAAAEESKRQSVEAEGGNPAEVLIKQRRLEEFEKEKEYVSLIEMSTTVQFVNSSLIGAAVAYSTTDF